MSFINKRAAVAALADVVTTHTRGFQNTPRRPNPAGVPKGLPPKIVNNKAPPTPLEIQEKEERARFARKTFYKTGVKWTPHPKLVNCNKVSTLESYLWNTQERLRWFRGEIADESRRSLRRSYLRTHISIHKLTEKFLINKIYRLNGELRIPKLIDYNSPWCWEKVNPYVNELNVVHRIQRSYEYPHKNILEPLARQAAVKRGEPLIDDKFAAEADFNKVQKYMARSKDRIYDVEKGQSVVVEKGSV